MSKKIISESLHGGKIHSCSQVQKHLDVMQFLYFCLDRPPQRIEIKQSRCVLTQGPMNRLGTFDNHFLNIVPHFQSLKRNRREYQNFKYVDCF